MRLPIIAALAVALLDTMSLFLHVLFDVGHAFVFGVAIVVMAVIVYRKNRANGRLDDVIALIGGALIFLATLSAERIEQLRFDTLLCFTIGI